MYMYEYQFEDELYHHGIKGQRWGVRRTKEELGYKTSSRKKKKSGISSIFGAKKKKSTKQKTTTKNTNKQIASKENNYFNGHKTDAKAVQKDIGDMTTQEIENYIKRINTEKSLASIVSEQEKAASAAGKVEKYIERFNKDYATVSKVYTTVTTSKLTKDVLDCLGFDSSFVKWENTNKNNNNNNNNNKSKKKKK